MGFRDLLGKELLFFDGATGTMLQALGLQPGELPELWNFTHAAEVQSVHEAYLNNGSNIIKSNTFGANRLKFKGMDITVDEVVGISALPENYWRLMVIFRLRKLWIFMVKWYAAVPDTELI